MKRLVLCVGRQIPRIWIHCLWTVDHYYYYY